MVGLAPEVLLPEALLPEPEALHILVVVTERREPERGSLQTKTQLLLVPLSLPWQTGREARKNSSGAW